MRSILSGLAISASLITPLPAFADVAICGRLLDGGVFDRTGLLTRDQRRDQAFKTFCRDQRLTEEKANAASGSLGIDVVGIFGGDADGASSGKSFRERVDRFCEASASDFDRDQQLALVLERASSALASAFERCVEIVLRAEPGKVHPYVEVTSETNFLARVAFTPSTQVKTYTILEVLGADRLTCSGDPLQEPLDRPAMILCSKAPEDEVTVAVRTDAGPSEAVTIRSNRVDPAALKAQLKMLSDKVQALETDSDSSGLSERIYVKRYDIKYEVGQRAVEATVSCDGGRALSGGWAGGHRGVTHISQPVDQQFGWRFRFLLDRPSDERREIRVYVTCFR